MNHALTISGRCLSGSRGSPALQAPRLSGRKGLGGRSKFWCFARALALCAAVAGLAGCKEPKLAVSVSGYNHLPEDSWSIAGFSVNGASGLNLQPHTGGGGFNCCIVIPERWQPGMKATLRWDYDVRLGDSRTPPPPQEAVVDIPDYNATGPATVDVHFYPDHRVKVVVSNYAIRHPSYPMSAEDKLPWVTDLSLVEPAPERR